MFCANCDSEVQESNGYCVQCGMSMGVRMCSQGHVIDPNWTECRYCNPAAASPGAAVGGGGGQGRMVLESPPPREGGFVRGATILKGGSPPVPTAPVRTAPVRTAPVPSASVPTAPVIAKKRTVFDPGGERSGSRDLAVGGPVSPLVGWLVSFSLDPAGVDLRVRAGRNVIGADSENSDICIRGRQAVSSNHAVLMYRDGHFLLRDNDSTNGTFVNGKDIFGQGAVEIHDRDEIRLGDVELVLHVI